MSQKNPETASHKCDNVQNSAPNASLEISAIDDVTWSEANDSNQDNSAQNFFDLNPDNIEAASNDDLLEGLFGNLKMFEPRNASLIITSQRIEIEEYKRQLKEYQEENQKIKQAYENLYVQKKKIEKYNFNISAMFEHLEQCGEQIKTYYNNVVDKFSELETAGKGHEKKFEILEKHVQGTTVSKREYDDVKKELEAGQKNYAAFLQKHEALTNNYDGILDAMKDVEAKNLQLNEDLKSFESLIQDKNQVITTMQEKEEQIKLYVGKLRDQISRLMNENEAKATEYQQQLTRKDEEFQQRQQEYESQVEGTIRELQENFQEMEDRKRNVESKLQENIKVLNQKLAKEEQTVHYINQLREQISRLTNEKDQTLQEFQNEISNKEQEIAVVCSNFERQMNEKICELERIKNMLTEADTKQTAQQTEINSLNEQLNDLKEENTNYKKANNQLISQLKDLEKGFGPEALKEIEEDRKRQCNTLNCEISDMKKQIFDFHRRELDYQKRVAELEQENKSMKQYVAQIENLPVQPGYSTPRYLNDPPVSPGLSPISNVSSIASKKVQKKVDNNNAKKGRPVPVATVVAEVAAPRFFTQTKAPGAKLAQNLPSTSSNKRSSPRNAAKKIKPAVIDLDSSMESGAPPTPNPQPVPSPQSSDVDIFNLNPLDISRHIGLSDFESDSESMDVEVVIKKKKKN